MCHPLFHLLAPKASSPPQPSGRRPPSSRLRQQLHPYPVPEEASGGGFSREDLDKGQMLMLGKEQQEEPLHADTGDLQHRADNGHSFPCTGRGSPCLALRSMVSQLQAQFTSLSY